ncbi:hypothetical protein CVT26_013637 [Gymnopilus dilepis]|uniref:HNH nuclease domain-containing protein n=1 Tax=Gymnopilus dilepis TaxID=231916 RepID=A0A409Y5S3_9AGAR|nr:hypothetical protein CVT26_013637 [Gymnopilus dilepis]
MAEKYPDAPLNQRVCIRVSRRLLAPSTQDSSLTTPSFSLLRHLYLIEGALEDVKFYAGTTVEWIIRVAHHICSPLRPGRVFTHLTENAEYWYDQEKTDNWRQISSQDPLLPGIYEFEADFPICLSRLSQKWSESSRTSSSSKSSAETFRDQVNCRDGPCLISNNPECLVAAHLVPKRLHTDGVKSVAKAFIGDEVASVIHRFHPMAGLHLFSPLAHFFELYEFGFYHVSDNTYVLHDFDPLPLDRHVFGARNSVHQTSFEPIHGYHLSLSSQDAKLLLPPPGLFNWQYLQCVVKRFGTTEYKTFPDIRHYVYPFRTYDDDTDCDFASEVSSILEPPYPAYNFDRTLTKLAERLQTETRAKEIVSWSADVASSTSGGLNEHKDVS